MKCDGQKNNKKRFNLVPNSVALGVAVFGARASLYSQQASIHLYIRCSQTQMVLRWTDSKAFGMFSLRVANV